MPGELDIRPATDRDRAAIVSVWEERWGSTRVVSRGRLHEPLLYPMLAAVRDGRLVGALSYEVRNGEMEAVTLDAFEPGRGIGSALLDAAAEEARRQGCRRLWLITTNDNTDALRFYQRRGMRLVALHGDAVADSRRLKPEIPEMGDGGIPIRDELELELVLECKT
jgi:ribosomal protein S18 acetylase RimI-like enzyme